ncbi:hypothetical protein FRX31_015902, partial [Thalictrum thalictroides]
LSVKFAIKRNIQPLNAHALKQNAMDCALGALTAGIKNIRARIVHGVECSADMMVAMVEVKRDAETTTTTSTIKAEPTITKDNITLLIPNRPTIYQVCGQEEHSALECPWKPLETWESHTLDASMDAIELRYSSLKECFNCRDEEDCPWTKMKCSSSSGCDGKRYLRSGGCDGKRCVRISEQFHHQNNEKMFLECYACNDFQWLTEAKKAAEAETSNRAESTIPPRNQVVHVVTENCP